MKWIFAVCLCCLIICQVFGAPTISLTDKQTDPLEEELVRHHHAILDGDKSNTESGNTERLSDPEQLYESMSQDPNIQPVDESELYDITVGDVIRDVLLTLRDNPEIVKELIASERAKLAEQIDAYNQQMNVDTNGEELSQQQQKQIEVSDNQNNVALSANDKPTELSSLEDDSQISGEKRADEVSNDAFTGADETRQFMKFMNRPVEGGQNIPLFGYDDKRVPNANLESNKMDATSRDKESETTESRELNGNNFRPIPYQMPFLNQFPGFRNYARQNAAGSTNDVTDDSTDENESRQNDMSMDSEEELAWLLQQERASKAKEEIKNTNGENTRNH